MSTTTAESIRITESSQPEGFPSALPNHIAEEYVALLVPPAHPEVGSLLVKSRSAPVEPALQTGETLEAPEESRPRELSRDEGQRLLDERARRYLGMSGEEFRRRYEAGDLDPDDDNVLRVAMLLPLGR